MKKTRREIVRLVVSILVLVGIAFFTGCTKGNDGKADESRSKNAHSGLSVYVVNYPLQYFAERIGGPNIRVTFPAPAEGDPAFWKPSPEQIVSYQKADLILLNGASYAKWLPHVSLPASRMVDTSSSFADQFIPIADRNTHSHGLEGKHEHGDVAFTTWLDPQQAIGQARAVRDALIRLLPEESDDFNRRFRTLENELNELDRQLASIVGSGTSVPLFFSHPVYQYLIRRYDLNGKSVHWEPEEEPSPDQWAAFKQVRKSHPAQWMIWEGTPNPAVVAALRGEGIKSLTFDPCGNTPGNGDYLSVMRQNATELSQAFKKP